MSYKFNPFTGALDIVSGSTDNYSYDYAEGTFTIPVYQQMIVYQNIEVEDNLVINGKLIILD